MPTEKEILDALEKIDPEDRHSLQRFAEEDSLVTLGIIKIKHRIILETGLPEEVIADIIDYLRRQLKKAK